MTQEQIKKILLKAYLLGKINGSLDMVEMMRLEIKERDDRAFVSIDKWVDQILEG